METRTLLRITVILGTLLLSTAAFAQGSHYWTRQYGARSTLLSNSVIGSVNDLGAVFYNPGRLGLLDNPTFLLSADVYEYSRILFKNIPGNDVNIATSDIGSVPGFVAGTFRFKKLPRHQFAYSALTRQRNDAVVRYREELDGGDLHDFPDIESVSSTVSLSDKLRQQWYSLSWSYSLENNWGIGATLSAVRYSSQKLTGLDIRALDISGGLGSYQYDRYYEFSQYGFLAKLGIAKHSDVINWGITITTPFLNLFGDGEIDFAEILNPLGSPEDNFFATNQQSGLEVTYKLPVSIGAGIAYKLPRTEIYFSAEWFAPISRYTIMTAKDFAAQSNGDIISFSVYEELRGVINFGIGMEYFVRENLSLYASASTDFSPVKDVTPFISNEIAVQNSTFSSNLYHVASGAVFQIENSDVTLGVTYTGAKQPVQRVTGLPGDDGDPVVDPDNPATFQWTRFQLVLGFSFSFIQN